MVGTVKDDIETSLNCQLFIKHLSDGLCFFLAIRINLGMVEKINYLILDTRFIDRMNETSEILSYL